jgi:hypothetical protein
LVLGSRIASNTNVHTPAQRLPATFLTLPPPPCPSSVFCQRPRDWTLLHLALLCIVALVDVVAGAMNGKWLERDSRMQSDAFNFLDRDFPIAERIHDCQRRHHPPPWTTLALGSAPSRANANIEPTRRKPRLPGPLTTTLPLPPPRAHIALFVSDLIDRFCAHPPPIQTTHTTPICPPTRLGTPICCPTCSDPRIFITCPPHIPPRNTDPSRPTESSPSRRRNGCSPTQSWQTRPASRMA